MNSILAAKTKWFQWHWRKKKWAVMLKKFKNWTWTWNIQITVVNPDFIHLLKIKKERRNFLTRRIRRENLVPLPQKMFYSWRQEMEWWYPRVVGREERRGTELVINGNRLSVGKDEKFPEMDGGDGCTPCHWNVHFKMVKMMHFVVCPFYNKT